MDSFSDRTTIEGRQFAMLDALLKCVQADNAFYRRKYKDVKLATIQDAPGLLRLPYTFKAEIVQDQLAHPPYGSNLTCPLDRYTRLHQTSGSSGTPMRWLDTAESWNWVLDNWVTVLRASGVVETDRLFAAFSFGPFLGFWAAFEAAARLGCLCIPGGGLSSLARLQMIMANEITVLCCTPTYALRLAEVARQEKIELHSSKVRLLIVAGEPGGSIPEVRELLTRNWNAEIKDHHGMTEIGPVSFECPASPGTLHVIEASYLPEIIDSTTGQPVPPGTPGELVLTNLGRTAAPLIRYRTGDLVCSTSSSPCRCGRYDLALQGGILGRIDDMLVVRGVNIYPSAIEAIVRRVPGIVEYRVLVETRRAMQELRLQVEVASSDAASALETQLATAFSLRIPVEVVAENSLPRYELKAKRWLYQPDRTL